MSGVSLRIVVVVLLLLVAGGLIAIVVVGGQNAIDGVEDVCQNLRLKISDSVTAEVVRIMSIPFAGMQRAITLAEEGIINCERWDNFYNIENGTQRNVAHFRFITQTKGWGSNLFLINEYGHEVSVSKSGTVISSPPLDQIVEGVPSWTIPCRYQANCTHPSNAANHQYCVNQSDPWAEMGGVMPPWAAGLGQQKGAEASYPLTNPEWARWAVARDAKQQSPTHCRPGAQTAKWVCTDGTACPEFNATFFKFDAQGRPYRIGVGDQDYDGRGRWWYLDTKVLPPRTKYYNAVKLCTTNKAPCLTASMPVHNEVPSVGAVVRTQDGRLGKVLRYVHTVDEMHTPVLAMLQGGAEEVWGRRKLSLACSSAEECAPLAIPAAPQTTTWKLYGVIATDFHSAALAEIGASFKVSKTGGVFMGDYTPEAKLLTSGFPCPAVYFENDNCFMRTVDGKMDRVSSFDPYAGDIVSGVMKELFHPVQVGGVWQSVEHAAVVTDLDETVSFGGSDYWVRFVPLSPRMGDITNLNWFICVVIPQKDYLEDIKKNQMVTLVVSLCVIAVVLASLLALTIFFVVRPVLLLLVDFDKASVMELETIEERSGGLVSEFASLQLTFNKVVRNLRVYRPFLPPSCFGMVDHSSSSEEAVSETRSGTGSSGSKSHTSMNSSIVSRKHVLANQVAAQMKKNKVSVVCASIANFTSLAAQKATSGLRNIHCDLVAQMLFAAGSRCSAEPFTGDRMRFTWNALKPCRETAAPFTAACQLADVRVDDTHLMHVGIAKGEAVCGTMGTDTMKNFCVVGACHSRSLLLMSFVGHYKPEKRILADGASLVGLSEADFKRTFVAAIMLGVQELEKPARTLLWTVEECVKDNEEWMYAMASKGVDEWQLFLTGKEHDWTTERIKQLRDEGVQGVDYVSEMPSVQIVTCL